MPQEGIHDAETNLDLRGPASDGRCHRERAPVKRILWYPKRAEAEFFRALGVRYELAGVRTFETDSEFANFGHRFMPRSRMPFAGLECTTKSGNATSSRPA